MTATLKPQLESLNAAKSAVQKLETEHSNLIAEIAAKKIRAEALRQSEASDLNDTARELAEINAFVELADMRRTKLGNQLAAARQAEQSATIELKRTLTAASEVLVEYRRAKRATEIVEFLSPWISPDFVRPGKQESSAVQEAIHILSGAGRELDELSFSGPQSTRAVKPAPDPVRAASELIANPVELVAAMEWRKNLVAGSVERPDWQPMPLPHTRIHLKCAA